MRGLLAWSGKVSRGQTPHAAGSVWQLASVYEQRLTIRLPSYCIGDPRPDAVVLWTRFTPPNNTTATAVQWYLSTDMNFTPDDAQ